VTKPNRAQAPKGANGTCRNRRRPRGVPRRPWARPFVRANRAICSAAWLILRTISAIHAAEQEMQHHPIRASRKIHDASARLPEVSARLCRAMRDLARTNAWIARDPQNNEDLPELLTETTESWIWVAEWLQEVTEDVFRRHAEILRALRTGELAPEEPEPPAARRPRIVRAPRPAAMRAFLRRRMPRVVDRIASILERRRRTPRPASIRVPGRNLQGRAPPFFSNCPL
jgi:hypothetical protein